MGVLISRWHRPFFHQLADDSGAAPKLIGFPSQFVLLCAVRTDGHSFSQVGPFFERVRRLADAVPRALDATGTFVAMNNRVSQSVPHLHAHVVPRRPKDGLRGFFWPRVRYEGGDAEMAGIADAIRVEVARSQA